MAPPRAMGALAVASLLTACTVGPDYVEPDLLPPDAWHAPLAGGLAAGATDAATLAAWWRQFDDAALASLVERALAANTDVRRASAALREARAARARAGADWYPTLSAGGSHSRSRGSGSYGTSRASSFYQAGFDAMWELDLFGAVRRSTEAAQAELEASEASLRDVQVSLAAEVALEYVNVRALQERLRIARRNLETQSDTAQLAAWRALAGLDSALDSEQARASMEQTRAQVPVLETGLAQALNRLAVLLAQAPGTLDAEFGASVPIPRPPLRLAVGIPADALRQRPDVRAAERTLAAATARIGVAEAARYPSFSLSGTLGLQSNTASGLDANDADAWSWAGSLAATLFDGGRLRQQVEIRTAQQEQALASWEATVLGALEETENALGAFAGSRNEQAALGAAADAARNAATLAQVQYESGLIDFATLLVAERTQLLIESSLAVASADHAGAIIRLYKALGGGWTPGQSAVPQTGTR
jgi:NodT family efflux transporter outer membrane factor (OMF) lipoprotein